MAKKVFNEKKYQKTRKILNIIGISWIVGVIVISTVLTCFGIYGANQAKKALTEAIDSTTQPVTILPVVTEPTEPTEVDMADQPYDLSAYAGPKTDAELDAAVAAIEAQHTIPMGQSGWYDDQVAESRATSRARIDFNEYESKSEMNATWLRNETHALEEKALEEKNIATEALNNITSMSSDALAGFSGVSDIAIGGMSLVALVGVVIATVVCCIPGIILLFVANSRAIYGFAAQSSVPVAKESTEQMSPTFGKVAKDITSGIMSGINGNKKAPAKKKRK